MMTEDKITKKRIKTLSKSIFNEFRTISEIGLKYTKEAVRSKVFLIIAILLPVFFMVFMSFAFSESFTGVQSYNIYVLNQDEGYSNGSVSISYGDIFRDSLINASYPEEETAIFHVEEIEEYTEQIKDNLIEARYILILIIPSNFSENIIQLENDVRIIIEGDPSISSYQSASSIITEIFNAFIQSVRSALGEISGRPIVTENFTIDIKEITFFDQLVPGIVILAISMNLNFVATVITEEYEFKTLERLQLTIMKPHHLLIGLAAAQMVIAAVQIVILLGLAALFGFHATGSFIIAGLIAWVLSIFSSALGFIIGAISKKGAIASGIGSIVAIPVFMLTGAFFPLNDPTLFTINGNPFSVLDIIPTRFAYRMMNQILLYNQGLGELSFELMCLLVLTLVYLLVGLVMITLLKLRTKHD